MEVMQYLKNEVDKKKEALKKEVDKKKEAAHQLKEDVEEVIEETLARRRSRRSNDAAIVTSATGNESSSQSSVSGTGCAYYIADVSVNAEMKLPFVEEVDDNHEDKSKSSVYLDESEGASQEGSYLDKIPEVEAMSAKLKDVDIQKVLGAVINGKDVEILKGTFLSGPTLPPSTKPREEGGTTSVGTEHLKIDIVDENDEEVLELEFERAVEKMHTHDYNMYCPNCSNRITKVILRRRKKTQSQDLVGCLSCFSIFIPKGNILNPLKIFGTRNKPGSSQIQQDQQPLLAPGFTAPHQQTPVGGASQLAKPNNNATGTVPHGKPPAGTSNGVSSADGSILNGNVIIDIPAKPDGTTQGTKHPISEIEEGQNATNGQYPGRDVLFPPEQRPVPSEPSQSTDNLTGRPLIAKEEQSSKSLDIMKSIVYGGLTESITSLSIVSSAAGSGATTLNIVALGLANLIGGLLVLFHNLKELRYEEPNEATEEEKSRYHELLGRKENFLFHTIFAVLSYLVFGLVPPLVYGFTFRETDDRDFKLLAVAASSLVCIVILAIAKAYTRGQHKFTAYTKTVLYYVAGAATASGIAYAVGNLFERLMDRLGWFDSNPVKHLLIPENKTWASF